MDKVAHFLDLLAIEGSEEEDSEESTNVDDDFIEDEEPEDLTVNEGMEVDSTLKNAIGTKDSEFFFICLNNFYSYQFSAKLESISPEDIAQAIINWYCYPNVASLLNLDETVSGDNNMLHIFQQPIDKDSLLWVCNIKESLSFALYTI